MFTVFSVYSSAQQCPRPSHLLTTHSVTHSKAGAFGPASSIHGKYSILAYHFLSFVLYFYCTFPKFRCTITYLCVITAYSIQYYRTCYTGL